MTVLFAIAFGYYAEHAHMYFATYPNREACEVARLVLEKRMRELGQNNVRTYCNESSS